MLQAVLPSSPGPNPQSHSSIHWQVQAPAHGPSPPLALLPRRPGCLTRRTRVFLRRSLTLRLLLALRLRRVEIRVLLLLLLLACNTQERGEESRRKGGKVGCTRMSGCSVSSTHVRKQPEVDFLSPSSLHKADGGEGGATRGCTRCAQLPRAAAVSTQLPFSAGAVHGCCCQHPAAVFPRLTLRLLILLLRLLPVVVAVLLLAGGSALRAAA